MNFESVQVSNYKGSSLGMILVLFILLVIVTSTFRKPLRGGSTIEGGGGDDISIEASRRFDIYNRTYLPRYTPGLTLVATNLYGDFESPPPPLHTIPPDGTYFFQVRRDPFYVTQAFATYNVLASSGRIVGSFEVRMQIDTHVPSTSIISQEGIDFVLDNGSTYVYVRNNLSAP